MTLPKAVGRSGAFADAVGDLVAKARSLIRKIFPTKRFPNLNFDDLVWNLKPFELSSGNRNSHYVSFRTLSPKKRERSSGYLPAKFANLFKAWIVLSDQKSTQANLAGQAAKYLWASLEQSGRAKTFKWGMLRNRDFEDAERIMIARGLEDPSRLNFCRRLSSFIEWGIDNEVLTEALTWIPEIRAAAPGSSQVRRDERLDRLPKRRVLQALGEIYLFHAKDPRDRLIICAIGLLLVAGFRITELLTLPNDCLITETRRGKICYGLKYWRRKRKRGNAEGSIRWLSPLGAELARECIAEINKLTKKARKRALVLEADQGTVAVPWGKAGSWLSRLQTARAFAISPDSLSRMLGQNELCGGRLRPHVIPGSVGGVIRFKRRDVEAELLRRRAPLIAFEGAHGERQMLSKTLLIEMDVSGNGQSVSELLVQHLPGHAVSAFLGCDRLGHGRQSAFSRFGYNDVWRKTGDEADRHRMLTHMARHWLNTVANKAGMTAFQVTLWMRRDDLRQTMVYLHDTADVADLTRERMRDGQLVGILVDEMKMLPEKEQEAFLDTIKHAHKTRVGNCTKALLHDSCQFGKRCEVGCRYHLYDSSDESAREELLRRLGNAKAALDIYGKALENGDIVQPRQMQMCIEEINAVESLLASDGVA